LYSSRGGSFRRQVDPRYSWIARKRGRYAVRAKVGLVRAALKNVWQDPVQWAQPPGARMAVREKTLTRCFPRVKTSSTSCAAFHPATRTFLLLSRRPVQWQVFRPVNFKINQRAACHLDRGGGAFAVPKWRDLPSTADFRLSFYFAAAAPTFKYLSYHAKIRFNRSSKCFSSRNPCNSLG